MSRGHVGGPELQSARAAPASPALRICVWPPRGARTRDSGARAAGGRRPRPEPQEPRACEAGSPGSPGQPRSRSPSWQEPEPAARFLQQPALGRGWGRAAPRTRPLPGLSHSDPGPEEATPAEGKLRFCFRI